MVYDWKNKKRFLIPYNHAYRYEIIKDRYTVYRQYDIYKYDDLELISN